MAKTVTIKAILSLLLAVSICGCIGSLIYAVSHLDEEGWFINLIGGLLMTSFFGKLSWILFAEIVGKSVLDDHPPGES